MYVQNPPPLLFLLLSLSLSLSSPPRGNKTAGDMEGEIERELWEKIAKNRKKKRLSLRKMSDSSACASLFFLFFAELLGVSFLLFPFFDLFFVFWLFWPFALPKHFRVPAFSAVFVLCGPSTSEEESTRQQQGQFFFSKKEEEGCRHRFRHFISFFLC
jgi:hypothetical protein